MSDPNDTQPADDVPVEGTTLDDDDGARGRTRSGRRQPGAGGTPAAQPRGSQRCRTWWTSPRR